MDFHSHFIGITSKSKLTFIVKQDRFDTGFKIAVRTGLKPVLFVFVVVKKDVMVSMSFKARTNKM